MTEKLEWVYSSGKEKCLSCEKSSRVNSDSASSVIRMLVYLADGDQLRTFAEGYDDLEMDEIIARGVIPLVLRQFDIGDPAICQRPRAITIRARLVDYQKQLLAKIGD